jgi:hypothetical protein
LCTCVLLLGFGVSLLPDVVMALKVFRVWCFFVWCVMALGIACSVTCAMLLGSCCFGLSHMQCLRGVVCVCRLRDGCTLATNAEAPHTTGVCTSRATNTTGVRSGIRTQNKGGKGGQTKHKPLSILFCLTPLFWGVTFQAQFFVFCVFLVCVKHRNTLGDP